MSARAVETAAGPRGPALVPGGAPSTPRGAAAPVALDKTLEPSGGGAGLGPDVLIAGRYRLRRLLGKGGMAEVWRATHEELRVDVAVKFVTWSLADDPGLAPQVLARFRFEAQVSARICATTRHVVAVYDAGEHRGAPYLVMELVEGRDLEQEVAAGGPLDPWRLAALLDQIADALDAAHRMGIVHRDIKPSNLLLSRAADGTELVKLADFGVAKATRSEGSFDLPRKTALGILVGSPGYMSPEQANGEADIRGTSDVWSLAVVVYEALTGKGCFEGRSLPELLIAIATRRYVPMSRIRPSLGRPLDEWLARCLAAEPGDRFQTASAMSEAFRRALPPPSSAARVRPRTGRWLFLAGAFAAGSAAVALSRFAFDAAPPPGVTAVSAAPSEAGLPLPAASAQPSAVLRAGPSAAPSSSAAGPVDRGPATAPSVSSAGTARPTSSARPVAPSNAAPRPGSPKVLDPSEIH